MPSQCLPKGAACLSQPDGNPSPQTSRCAQSVDRLQACSSSSSEHWTQHFIPKQCGAPSLADRTGRGECRALTTSGQNERPVRATAGRLATSGSRPGQFRTEGHTSCASSGPPSSLPYPSSHRHVDARSRSCSPRPWASCSRASASSPRRRWWRRGGTLIQLTREKEGAPRASSVRNPE